MNERFVVLGVAPARREWFRQVARWANEAALPIEFVKCLSTSEVMSRLETGQPFSAVLADASTNGLDRDLLDLATSVGCAPIIVDHGLVDRDWESLGARAVLAERFESGDLLAALEESAIRIGRGNTPTVATSDDSIGSSASVGAVVAVTGAGGIGTSTIAMALAQGLVRFGERQRIVLADMALRSSQAMFHDARDVIPGLLELVDAHRLGVPTAVDARSNVHRFPERGYDLVLGLRHERDWGSIPARALSATWGTLTSLYATTICDITGDFDGAEETGSNDIEDRNRLARMAATQADIILVVGSPGSWGIHHLVRTAMGLHELGVPPSRLLPVINHAPRHPRARASITSAVGDLLASRIPSAQDAASPIFIPTKKHLEATLREGDALPTSLANPLGDAVNALLGHSEQQPASIGPDAALAPVPVAPGSLGSWRDFDE